MSIGSLEENGGGRGDFVPGPEWLWRALLLDPAVPDPGVACWADARSLGLVRLPILLGWRRSGGAVVVGTSERVAEAGLLTATLELAERTAEWTPGRWGDAFHSFWSSADASLRAALATRLPLPTTEPWSLVEWSEAVWGTYAESGSTAVALVARELGPDVLSSLEWLGRRTGWAAGYSAEPLDEDGRRIRCFRVAGSLGPEEARPLPGEAGRSPTDGSPDPLDTVERLALDAGATASWSRRDWVRFHGAGGTIRVFPREDAVWLQLVGADEGTLAGLRFRHGVPLEPPGSPDAPPGAHLALRSDAEVTAEVEAVIREWLQGG